MSESQIKWELQIIVDSLLEEKEENHTAAFNAGINFAIKKLYLYFPELKERKE
jgi:hypothetical protein